MDELKQVVAIHKRTQKGFTRTFSSMFLTAWYLYRLWVAKDCILITKKLDDEVIGFILYNLDRHEILVMSIDTPYQSAGFGKELLDRIKERCTVLHDKNDERASKFYTTNKFKDVLYVGKTGKQDIWLARRESNE